jgi:hypothetical protein
VRGGEEKKSRWPNIDGLRQLLARGHRFGVRYFQYFHISLCRHLLPLLPQAINENIESTAHQNDALWQGGGPLGVYREAIEERKIKYIFISLCVVTFCPCCLRPSILGHLLFFFLASSHSRAKGDDTKRYENIESTAHQNDALWQGGGPLGVYLARGHRFGVRYFQYFHISLCRHLLPLLPQAINISGTQNSPSPNWKTSFYSLHEAVANRNSLNGKDKEFFQSSSVDPPHMTPPSPSPVPSAVSSAAASQHSQNWKTSFYSLHEAVANRNSLNGKDKEK